MKTSTDIYVLLLLLAVFSCSDGSRASKEAMTNIDDFRTYSIEVESKTVPIFDLIESVEILRLEETEQSLLPDIYSVEMLVNKFLIANPSNGIVYVFDEQGGFVSSLSKLGNGPKEYAFMLTAWAEGESIVVFDTPNIRLQKYDVDGNHLSSLRLPYSPGAMTYLQGKYYLDLSRMMIDDNKKFSVVVLNEKTEVLNMTIPFELLKPFSLYMGDPFIVYNDKLTFHDAMSDTVYMAKDDTFEPLFSIDFGDKWAWRDQQTFGERSKAMTMLQRSGFVQGFKAVIGGEYIMLEHFWNGKGQFSMIDRSSGFIQRIKIVKESREDYSFIPIKWEGDQLLVSVRSPDVSEFIKSVGEGRVKFRKGTTLEEIESSENPVLMWVKFK